MVLFKRTLPLLLAVAILLGFNAVLSAQTLSQTIMLKTGHNFAALTLKPSLTPPQLKTQNSSAIEDIYTYSAAAGSFLSVNEGTLNIFNPAAGYIFQAKSDAQLVIAGTAIPSAGDINLRSGFNLTGFSKVPETISFSSLMKKYSFVKGVYKWHAAAGSFIQVVRGASGTPEAVDGSDPVFTAGQAYFINLSDDAVLNYDGASISLVSKNPVPPVTKYNLNISVTPSSSAGTVSVSLAGPYDSGAIVSMTAEAYIGYSFKGWQGTDAVSVSNGSVTMNSDKYVIAVFESAAAPTSKSISVDAANDLGSFKLIVGSHNGPVSLVKNADETARYKELGFKVIRTLDYYGPFTWYNIFPDFSKDPELEDSYDFETTDVRVKKLVDEGFEILFSFSPSWSDPVFKNTADPPGTIRDSSGRITHTADLNDFKKFANICKHIAMHYNAGWKNGYYYNIKRWEMWNEPETNDIFWKGTPMQFYQMFAELAKTFRAYDPSLLIYGPGNAEVVPPSNAGVDSATYTSQFLDYCGKNSVPIDVYTWHSYGGETKTPSHIKTVADDIRTKLTTYGYGSAKMSCDEWNSGINQDNFSDTGKGAAYYGCALAFMTEKDLIEMYQYRGDDHPLGIIRQTDGQFKTAAYTLKAWKQMTESCTRLSASTTETGDFAVMASKSSSDGSYYVMASNCTTESKTMRLAFSNMASLSSKGWTVTRKVITDTQKLATAETGYAAPGGSVDYTFELPAGSVAFIQFSGR